MLDENVLLKILNNELDVGNPTYNPNGITVGVVVDTDDPLQNGRLRVFCANLNDDPKKLHHLPWAAYVSPYGGVISNNQFSRGAGKGPEKSDGATAYGFWGIPEQGSLVLVTCIDGDERRRVWMGCMQPHREAHSLFHGRYDWKEGGEVDGPLTSKKSPIEPQYTNANTAFQGEKDSAEWKTRQAEYQPTGNVDHEEGNMVDQQYNEISESEKDEWVKPIVGAHGYDWSGNKALGSFLASRVFGFSTPGFHAFTMDDRPSNSRIRLRSSTGHQILLDDTNERIYVATNEGKSWIEMDSNGNIDGYSDRRISMRAKEDINFSTDGTFRVKANKGIHMYAGDTRKQEPLEDDKPEIGEIRLHSTADTHMLVEKNLRVLVYENKLEEIAKDICKTVGGDVFEQYDGDVNKILNHGNFNISINGDYNHHASNDSSIFSGNNNHIQAVNDTEIFAYTGKMDIGSQLDMTIKAEIGDVTMEALTNNMKLMSNEGKNQITMRNPFMNFFSIGQIVSQSKEEVAHQTNSDFDINADKVPVKGASPLNGGCINFTDGINVSFGQSTIDLSAVDDIQFKMPDVVTTSVNTINESLEILETELNNLSFSSAFQFLVTAQAAAAAAAQQAAPALAAAATMISILQNLTLPNLTFKFPMVVLPELDFDFCINTGDFLNIEDFNPIPHGLFGNVNIDLGGWTKDNFKDWFDRHKAKIDNSVNNIKTADEQFDASLNTAISEIKSATAQVNVALDDLIDITITSNQTHIESYSIGMNDFESALGNFNSATDNYNQLAGSEVVPRLTELENVVANHARSVRDINRAVQLDPATVIGFDYSELLEASTTLNNFRNAISGYGP